MRVLAMICGLAALMSLASCERRLPEDDVRAAWNEFKEASLSGKGEVAASRVTHATLEYYEEIRHLSLEADKAALQKLTLSRQMTVLGIRIRITAEQLRAMNGRELFVYAVDQGWIGKNNATDEDIGEIMITGDHARAVATKAGMPTQMYFNFVREDGTWRVDMMQLMKMANTAYSQMRQQSGLSEEKFLERMIEIITGQKLTEDLWNPAK